MRFKKSCIFLNQRGSALVVALVMMIVLTLISLSSIVSSTFDIKISGNKRGMTNAFYGAESGIQAAVSDLENFNLARYDTNNKYENALNDGAKTNSNPASANVDVLHDTLQSGCPRGSGFGTHVDCLHFVVTATGEDQLDVSTNKSACTVEEKVARIIPTVD
jgi:Tfp pilus assembly protein PilX